MPLVIITTIYSLFNIFLSISLYLESLLEKDINKELNPYAKILELNGELFF